MVRPERFELPTYCSGGNRSIHLSYGRTVASVYMGGRRSINGRTYDECSWRFSCDETYLHARRESEARSRTPRAVAQANDQVLTFGLNDQA